MNVGAQLNLGTQGHFCSVYLRISSIQQARYLGRTHPNATFQILHFRNILMRRSRQYLSFSFSMCIFFMTDTSFAQDAANQNQAQNNWPHEWTVVAGIGAVDTPLYPGSSVERIRPWPIVSATYGRYFIGGVPGAGSPAGFGLYFLKDSHWRLGASLSYDFIAPREESEDEHALRGLGSVARTAHATIFGSYTDDWFTVRSSVTSDIAGKHEGTTATLDLEGTYRPTDSLTLSAGPGVTWANTQYNQTFFGVDSEQNIRSGYAIYTPKSGVASARFSLSTHYKISDQWSAGIIACLARLEGDEANSPITMKKTQIMYGMFALYSF
jgi:MipA family protein